MIDLTDLRFTSAPPHLRASGLLGWVRFVTLDGLVIDGVGVRRTREGIFALSFPERTSRDGTRHAIVRPVDDRTRREIEDAVFDALDIDPEEVQP
ncbi:MAG: septation protein SpoVG family protein [Phycisphaerales bacterium]|nr:septation protein SpoVG family protein [Phycisphaerales bacterium]